MLLFKYAVLSGRFFVQVVPQGAKPQCVGCALSFSTAKTSAVVLCHPRLLEWEAVARDVERCLSDCAGKASSPIASSI